MEGTIVVAILSVLGTGIGSLGGILTSNKLTNYRIRELEKKVDKHNTIIERTYKLESQICEVINDITEIKEEIKNEK